MHFETGEVVGVGFDENLIVETAAQSYQADFVILATGSPRATPRIPGIEAFEGKATALFVMLFFIKEKMFVF